MGSDGGLVDLNNFSGLKSAPLVDQPAWRVLKLARLDMKRKRAGLGRTKRNMVVV